MRNRKIAVIGAGFVGATTAYTLMISGIAEEIVLVDVNKDKAEGDAKDMSHGAAFVSPVEVKAGDYAACDGADLIIITAGAGQKPGETRLDLLRRNVAIFRSIFDALRPYLKQTAVVLVVANPVDLLTYLACKLSGLPKHQVLGSGTVLDTARLQYYISEHTGVDARDVRACIVGEHGDSEVAAWSQTSIAGLPLDEYCLQCRKCEGSVRACKQELFVKTRDAAYGIIEKKGATYYAVALAVRRIVEAIFGNQHSILNVSSLLEGEYGIGDVCLSVPAVVGGKGLEKLLGIAFTDEELAALQQSAAILKEQIASVEI